MSYLLDTNVLSELYRLRPDENVVKWLASASEDEMFVSVVSLGELRRGIALLPAGRRRRAIEDWMHGMLNERLGRQILDLGREVAETWGELMAHAKRKSSGPHVVDTFLAATAKVHGLKMVTRNARDFRVFDLEIVNPWHA